MVVAGTPIDLAAVMRLDKPVVQARYELAEVGEPRLSLLVEEFLAQRGLPRLGHGGGAKPGG